MPSSRWKARKAECFQRWGIWATGTTPTHPGRGRYEGRPSRRSSEQMVLAGHRSSGGPQARALGKPQLPHRPGRGRTRLSRTATTSPASVYVAFRWGPPAPEDMANGVAAVGYQPASKRRSWGCPPGARLPWRWRIWTHHPWAVAWPNLRGYHSAPTLSRERSPPTTPVCRASRTTLARGSSRLSRTRYRRHRCALDGEPANSSLGCALEPLLT